MKKIYLFCILLPMWLCTQAFSGGALPTLKATQIFLRLDSNTQISLADLAIIKERDLEKITHKNLNLFERIGFGIAQRKLQKSIRADGTIDTHKIDPFGRKQRNDNSKPEGFALGFLLAPLGVLIAYLIKDEHTKTRVKWAWLGFATTVLLVFVLVLIAIAALGQLDLGHFNII